VQTRRLAMSFDASTRSITRTAAEKFPCKVTCISAFFVENPQKQADAELLKDSDFRLLSSNSLS